MRILWKRKGKTMHEVVAKLMGEVIVSVQAYEDTPLYGPDHMKAMAESVLMGGAKGVRACWPQDVKAIRSITDKPIVGIYKEYSEADPLDTVFITPTYERAVEIIEAGADILGVDCTIREHRGLDDLLTLLSNIKQAYPTIAIMADIATLEEGIAMAESGLVDIISTTLSGYTRNSVEMKTDGPNIELIRALKEKVSLPINGEGRVWTLEDMQAMMDAGADIITIGTAITRPHLITERFVASHDAYLKGKKNGS